MTRKKICPRCNKIVDEKSNCCIPIRSKIKKEQLESDKILRSTRWRKKRLEIIDRDSGLCQRCLIKFGIFNSTDLTVHHIISRKEIAERGEEAEYLLFDNDNLVCICRTCNLQLESVNYKHQLDFEFTPKEREFSL